MRKLILLLATAATLAACQQEQGYVIKGNVEGAENGDTIILSKAIGRSVLPLDTAIIQNYTFEFKGMADSVATTAVVSYKPGEKDGMGIIFFLENGHIYLRLTSSDDSAVGTPCNNAYQEVRSQLGDLYQQKEIIYNQLSDTTLTDQQRQAKLEESDKLDEQSIEVMKEGAIRNITNPVGLYLLKQCSPYFELGDLEEILPQVPAAYQSDSLIIKLTSKADILRSTAKGKPFTDFEMKTPEGKPVKLSDYAGKGKVVLIDFWASWCPPCRREMPNLVQLYAQYKNKGFEIVGVSLDHSAEAWKNGIEKLNITWPQMSDLKYWKSQGAALYGVNSIPHTVLLDGNGVILERGLYGDGLKEKLAALFQE
ncbi:MAG: AhpC/TSA family protein [Prevotellaceae bacterium]|jgi:peroxiredoxin|nr:AhpC/TSA family protein [Prevotellaceae bacterium]